MLFQCWASVEDGGPTLKQHRVNVSCLLGLLLKDIVKLKTIKKIVKKNSEVGGFKPLLGFIYFFECFSVFYFVLFFCRCFPPKS